MAAVRIEGEAFSDERYEDLALHADLADADHARGKMAKLWRQCTIEQTHVLPNALVERILGEHGVRALCLARLGEEVDGGVRIRGTQGRIEWLKKLRKNGKFGKLGGRPKKTHKGFETETHVGGVDETPIAPAPALAPALAPSEKDISTPKKQGTRTKRQTLPPEWAPKPKHKEIASSLGRDLNYETDHFRDTALARGYQYADWDAAFCKWLRNEQYRGNGSNQGTHATGASDDPVLA